MTTLESSSTSSPVAHKTACLCVCVYVCVGRSKCFVFATQTQWIHYVSLSLSVCVSHSALIRFHTHTHALLSLLLLQSNSRYERERERENESERQRLMPQTTVRTSRQLFNRLLSVFHENGAGRPMIRTRKRASSEMLSERGGKNTIDKQANRMSRTYARPSVWQSWKRHHLKWVPRWDKDQF